MCGIVGVYNYNKNQPVSEKLLIAMRDTMSHRGPDGACLWISPGREEGLGQRRLSIIVSLYIKAREILPRLTTLADLADTPFALDFL